MVRSSKMSQIVEISDENALALRWSRFFHDFFFSSTNWYEQWTKSKIKIHSAMP